MTRARATAEQVAEELNTNSAENSLIPQDKLLEVRVKAMECAEAIFTENQHPSNANQIEALKVAVELLKVLEAYPF